MHISLYQLYVSCDNAIGFSLKDIPSGLRQILATENPLKMMKITFNFTS